jgi:hypothetical protein
MVGMLFNNILYCFSDIYIISYLLDFIIGNSITTTFLLYVCSYVFGFCKWHRFIITANIINLLIANLDAYYRIPISDIQLLIVYHFVAALFICISTYIHIKNNRDERILHCSPSSFDNYIKLGLIPRGHKEYGFKELSWSEKDFDKATLARIKKYRDKQLVFDYNDIETFKQNILN